MTDDVAGMPIADLTAGMQLPSTEELKARPHVGIWSPSRGSDELLKSRRAAGLSMVLASTEEFVAERFEPEVAKRVVTVQDVDVALGVLDDGARSNPVATSVLHHVLVSGEGQTTDAAFAMESFAYSTLMAGPEFARWLSTRSTPVSDADESTNHVTLHSSDKGNTLLITLDRTQLKNAFGRVMRAELFDALTVLDHAPGMRAIIRGAGDVFCSGGDLSEFGLASEPATAHLIRTEQHVGRVIVRHRDRITVHAHGACIGAGVELPALADRFVAVPGTWFRLPEVGMGLIPGAGGTVSVARRIGRWRAAYMAMTGCRIDTCTALDWGLIDDVVDF